MLIKVERLEGVGLPLIEQLPDFRLARMEGYNGIGKSLTIRLLQLAVGRQTFHQVRTWESFLEGLGRLRIRARGLDGAKEIVWEIDSRDLPGEPTEVDDDWFRIAVDGKTSNLGAVVKLLSVHRLPGDTGLAETLGEQVEADRRAFSNWHRPLTADGGPLTQTLDLLDHVNALVGRVEASRILSARANALEATTELERQRERLREAVARQATFSRARAVSQRLAEFTAFGADVDAQAERVEAALTILQGERAAANAALADLEAAAARSEEARRRIRAVRKRLETHFGHLTVARLQEAELLQRAQITDVRAVEEALNASRAGLSTLVERRAALDATPLVHELVAQLRILLERAEADGLGPQLLLGDDHANAMRVTDFRSHLERREQELAGVEPSAEGQALGEAIDAESTRIQALEQLGPVRTEVERRARLIATAEAEIQQLVSEADNDVVVEVEEKRRQLADLDERAASLARERTVLAIRKEAIGGGRTADETEAEYRALLTELGVDDTALEDEASKQDELVRVAQLAHHQAHERATAAREKAAELDEDLRRVVNMLAEDDSLNWLSTVSPLPRAEQQIEAQLAAIEKIHLLVASAMERAGAVQGQVAGIEVALDRLATRLKGQAESGGRRYAEQVTRGYGREFRGWFNDTLVRTTLLPDAKQIVSVDLRPDRLEVEWETPTGAKQSRPLDAFSRGEQAFAYTRARLASLDVSPTQARNRLIVLDEFGAFIARDRLQALVDLLKERERQFPNDQVLLILPIAADYRQQVKTAIQSERHRLEPVVRDLDKKGYFVVEL